MAWEELYDAESPPLRYKISKWKMKPVTLQKRGSLDGSDRLTQKSVGAREEAWLSLVVYPQFGPAPDLASAPASWITDKKSNV